MVYVDFDGVVLDSEKLLFEEWRKNPDRFSLPESEKIKYIQNANWEYILNNASIINDSTHYLKNMDLKNSAILTKIYSLNNEGKAKIKWIRTHNIKQSIILVPYFSKKCEVVPAKGNILIDDCLRNLDEWLDCGGKPIFFDSDNDDYDSWEKPNTKHYQKVLDLSNYTKK